MVGTQHNHRLLALVGVAVRKSGFAATCVSTAAALLVILC
jgi:hypothetical protein